jgi:Sir2- and TIR-associating SLOG family/SIR2-like domain
MSVELPSNDENAARMPGFARNEFINEYTKAMDDGRGALFLGAGASIPAGFISWSELMGDIARELDLDLDRVTDLLTLAQYHVNHRGGRHGINEQIIEEFDRRASRTPLHDLIVRLPVDEVWTTNYDRLIENAYERVGRNADVKFTVATLAAHKRSSDVTIYKMHGDARVPDEAVLTRDDYERYHIERRGQAFMTALEASLLSRTFLFVGFSFNDPNIQHVLARMRLLIGQNRREHFAILRRPDWYQGSDPERRAQMKFDWRTTQLQIDDLKRFGMQVVLVNEYTDIAPLVGMLVKSSRRNYVFVSGAAEDSAPFGEKRLIGFSRLLGATLAENGKFLISGFGVGVGQDVVQGFFQAGYEGRARDVGDRALLRPFPQRAPGGAADLVHFWTDYRTDMVQRAGFVVYIAGNKRDQDTGANVPSSGMLEEFELAQTAGAVPIPVGATGHVAAELWHRVTENAANYYPDPSSISSELAALNDPGTSDEGHLSAILRIMTAISRTYQA